MQCLIYSISLERNSQAHHARCPSLSSNFVYEGQNYSPTKIHLQAPSLMDWIVHSSFGDIDSSN